MAEERGRRGADTPAALPLARAGGRMLEINKRMAELHEARMAYNKNPSPENARGPEELWAFPPGWPVDSADSGLELPGRRRPVHSACSSGLRSAVEEVKERTAFP